MFGIFGMEKGQAVSLDCVIAVAIFLIAMTVLISIWGNQINAAAQQLFLQDMQDNASRTIDFLVRSKGETIYRDTNWEYCCAPGDDEHSHLQNKVKFIGLAQRDRVLSQAKVTKFVELINSQHAELPVPETSDYNRVKSKMLLNYDYYFRLLDKYGNPVEEPEGTIMEGGDIVPSNALASIILKRIVNYEGTNYNGEAIVEIQFFRRR